MNDGNMSVIKVINVGQGDSLIYSNPFFAKCETCRHDILIDVGLGNRDVFKHVNKDSKCILLLSHSHLDHIGGLVHLATHTSEIHQVWVPNYYDEILTITDFLIQISKSNRSVINCAEYARANLITRSGNILRQLSDTTRIPFIGVNDGFSPCPHLNVLNPPLNAIDIFGLQSDLVDNYIKQSRESNYRAFRPIFGDDFDIWKGSFLSEGWTYQVGVSRIAKSDNDNWDNRMKFIYSFLYQNFESIQRFSASPTPHRFANLLNIIKLTSNRASIVLRVDMPPENALFTGDADKTVFKRLIKSNSTLNARYLKIPHHGSKYNITKHILTKIHPEVAIVCHDNHRFGRQRDPHPHTEVIQMLDSNRITTLYTNDVIKQGNVIKQKPRRGDYYYGCEFID
jgi:beta-lactamase superfamily II metal-dependent hydrolase